jgi:DNA-binding response OmpR family regulator
VEGIPFDQQVATLRLDPVLTSVPILVTGMPPDARVFEAGADDCVLDPLLPELLTARVRRLLARRGHERLVRKQLESSVSWRRRPRRSVVWRAALRTISTIS